MNPTEPTTHGFHSGNAWGPCIFCGELLNHPNHDAPYEDEHPLAPGDAGLLVYPQGDADVVLVLDDLDVGGTATVKLPSGKIVVVDRDSVSYFGPGTDFRPVDRVADAEDYMDALGDPSTYR